MSDDVFDDSDDVGTGNDLNFDVNTDSIKPTSKRVARPTHTTDDEDLPGASGADGGAESLEDEREQELAGLEVDDDYFANDSWEQ